MCAHQVRQHTAERSSTLQGGQATNSHQQEGFKGQCPRCGAIRIDRQLGLEATPAAYVANLVAVFREVRRVLRPAGTLWLVIGDSYCGGKGQSGSGGAEHQAARNKNQRSLNTGYQTLGGKQQTKPTDSRAMLREAHLKPKDLMGIPWMVAFALREDGWYLRQDIIWAKKAPMPESVKDRCTRSHEYIFLLSKSRRYYYDAQAIREAAKAYQRKGGTATYTAGGSTTNGIGSKSLHQMNEDGRNCRDVWTIATQPTKGLHHYATFPPEVPRRCILAGCPPGGVVLDPFSGSGTTGLVALRLGRKYVGIELNPHDVERSRRRLRDDAPLFNRDA